MLPAHLDIAVHISSSVNAYVNGHPVYEGETVSDVAAELAYEKELEQRIEEHFNQSEPSEASDEDKESLDSDDFEVNDSDVSDEGGSEPSDGESIGSKDSERSEESGSDEFSDEEEIVYDSESDGLDRLDALAERVTQAAKRQKFELATQKKAHDKKMIAFLRDCGR